MEVGGEVRGVDEVGLGVGGGGGCRRQWWLVWRLECERNEGEREREERV